MVTFLDVPYCEKDDAKSMGAKWNPVKKSWFAPNDEDELIERWGENLLNSLDGEDRTFGGNDLFVDMIPRTSWFNNVRKAIVKKDWVRIKKLVCGRTNYTCECCGSRQDIEVHERFEYNKETRVQKLMRFVALCQQCHQSTHLGLAGSRGKGKEAEQHLSNVRGFTPDELRSHTREADSLWTERSKITWTVDLSLMENNGIEIIQTDSLDVDEDD